MQAEPSRFNLAVVAKERKGQDVATEKMKELAANDEKWVIKDTVDISKYKELIPDPAIEYNFELDDF